MALRYMVFCPRCNYLGSIEKGDNVPSCPKCGTKLLFPNVDKESWSRLTEEQKAASKAHWISGNGGIHFDVSSDMRETQEELLAVAEERQEKKRAIASMLISSGFSFDGYRITKYSGYISGDDACQIPRSGIFGSDNGKKLTNALVHIRRQALNELKEAAYDLGCNAVIGVDFDYITLEPETASLGGGTLYEPYIICVTANGNAVYIEKE